MRSTQFVPKYDPSVAEIAAGLKKGQAILIPTDTIWAIAADPFKQEVYDRLYSIKQKPKNQALILLVSGIDMLKRFVDDIHPRIETLLVYHKRPLTIVYGTPKNLPTYLLGNDGSIAIRIVKSGICKEIIECFDSPLATSSANIYNGELPTTFDQIAKEITAQVDIIIEHTAPLLKNSEASVIAKFDDLGELIVLRE